MNFLEPPLRGENAGETASRLFARFPEIVGRSPEILGVLQSIIAASNSDIPVLVEGESGTGKELVARAIHQSSRRVAGPFLSENCAALPENLAESELFGHEKGAFTGAERVKQGLFERARGGTVFLDEVGEMDIPLQRKLLRVLQEKVARRVGGEEPLSLDFRVISATNRVLEEMIAAGKFREDLYYRLNVVTIAMPALRERPGDIPLLVEHFNQTFARETGKKPLELSGPALDALASYGWPGNVRELRNEVWRLACGERTRIEPENLTRRILKGRASRAGGRDEPPEEPPRTLDALERDMIGGAILDALRCAGGNRAEAARRLGITRSSLYRRMARYGLHYSPDVSGKAPGLGPACSPKTPLFRPRLEL